jgi:hypothetical protein
LFPELPTIFPLLSKLPTNGLNALPSMKSETKPTADLVGLSELEKPSLTEFVLPTTKLPTPESLWTTSLLVADLADSDVEEDTPSKLGDIGSLLESLLVTDTEITNGANHTFYLLVDFLALLKKLLPLLALNLVTPTILETPLMLMIKTSDNLLTLLLPMLLLFKLKL